MGCPPASNMLVGSLKRAATYAVAITIAKYGDWSGTEDTYIVSLSMRNLW